MFKHVGVIMLLAALAVGQTQEEKPPCKDEGRGVFNADLAAKLKTDFGEQTINGRVSGAFRVTREELEKGYVRVVGLSVAFNDVLQAAVTGRDSQCDDPTGSLGFSAAGGEGGAVLEYDADSQTLSGYVKGTVSTDQFTEINVRQEKVSLEKAALKDAEEEPDFDFPVQTATINMKIVLSKPLTVEKARTEPVAIKGQLIALINVDANDEFQLRPFTIDPSFIVQEIIFEAIWWPVFEVVKKLCLQPVRVQSVTASGFFLQLLTSGSGHSHFIAEATEQFRKSDIVFEVRPWITVWSPSYYTLTEGEAAGFRGLVNQPDCIEIFYAHEFSPESMWGGGATWGGGTSSSKVIMSDGNAETMVTRLAHELTHVMTLKHPGSGFPMPGAEHRVSGSSGTIACPSGFFDDNPQVESQHNKDSYANPLFTWTLKAITSGVDCQGTAANNDCGLC